MITTTLNKILKCGPCGQEAGSSRGWDKLLKFLNKTEADDEELSLLTILESNGLSDAIWALRATNGYDREIRLFACKCACEVLHLFESKYPDDLRPRIAIETAVLYAEDLATEEELADAASAAYAAAYDAAAAAADADNAYAAAAATADAAYAADASAADAVAAYDAAAAATRNLQKEEFIKLCKEGREYGK